MHTISFFKTQYDVNTLDHNIVNVERGNIHPFLETHMIGIQERDTKNKLRYVRDIKEQA